MEKLNYEEFMKNYKKWIKECRKEIQELNIGNPYDWEICENGDIHHVENSNNYLSKVVTKWKDSKYYCE